MPWELERKDTQASRQGHADEWNQQEVTLIFVLIFNFLLYRRGQQEKVQVFSLGKSERNKYNPEGEIISYC